MLDRKLVALVGMYVKNANSAFPVDIQSMADDLQRTEKEYFRKPKQPFRKAVEKAYDHIKLQMAASSSPSNGLACQTEGYSKKRQYEHETDLDFKRQKVEEDQTVSCDLYKNISDDKKCLTRNVNNSVNCLMTGMYMKRMEQQRAGMSSVVGENLSSTSSSPTEDHPLFVIDRQPNSSKTLCDLDEKTLIPIENAEVPVVDNTSEEVHSNTNNVSALISVSEQQILAGKENDITDNGLSNNTVKKVTAEAPSAVKPKTVQKSNVTKRSSANASEFKFRDSHVRSSHLAGFRSMMDKLAVAKIFSSEGPMGILVTGPTGCGKTKLAEAIIGELRIPFVDFPASKLTNNQTREEFRDIVPRILSSTPCAVLFENVLYNYNNEAGRMDSQVADQLKNLFREVTLNKKCVWIIATALNSSSIDKELLGKGAFEVHIPLSLPNESTRAQILELMLTSRGVNLETDLNFSHIARDTPAYSPRDYEELIDTCLLMKRLSNFESRTTVEECQGNKNSMELLEAYQDFPKEQEVMIGLADFQAAMKITIPTATQQNYFVQSSNVTWDDVGGMEDIREELKIDFLAPIQHPETYKALVPRCQHAGILFWGPPGCGKTLIAKALANEASMNFMAINGPELFRKYVGESERLLRETFELARKSSPCIIYFDEIDALCQKRDSGEGGSRVNMVNQILPLLDGMWNRGQVYVIGSTNRLDCVDPALLRTGRFDKVIYIGPPTAEQRYDILKALTKNGTEPSFADDIDLKNLAEDQRCHGLTGADLNGLVIAAGQHRLRQCINNKDNYHVIGKDNLEAVLEKTVTEKTNVTTLLKN